MVRINHLILAVGAVALSACATENTSIDDPSASPVAEAPAPQSPPPAVLAQNPPAPAANSAGSKSSAGAPPKGKTAPRQPFEEAECNALARQWEACAARISEPARRAEFQKSTAEMASALKSMGPALRPAACKADLPSWQKCGAP